MTRSGEGLSYLPNSQLKRVCGPEGLTAPGNVQNPPVVDGSYFDSQQRVTNEPPKFDWTSRRRGWPRLSVVFTDLKRPKL